MHKRWMSILVSAAMVAAAIPVSVGAAESGHWELSRYSCESGTPGGYDGTFTGNTVSATETSLYVNRQSDGIWHEGTVTFSAPERSYRGGESISISCSVKTQNHNGVQNIFETMTGSAMLITSDQIGANPYDFADQSYCNGAYGSVGKSFYTFRGDNQVLANIDTSDNIQEDLMINLPVGKQIGDTMCITLAAHGPLSSYAVGVMGAAFEYIWVAGEAQSGKFSDVAADAFYSEAVNWAVENNITNGTSLTTFSPDTVCTQAQILTFLWRANGSPDIQIQTPFPISADSYYAGALRWAWSKGIIDQNFNPDIPCTRGTAVLFLYKNAGQPNSVYQNQFSDVGGTGYESAVQWALDHQVTMGTGNGQFSPYLNCTRSQIVTFLHRAIKKN